MPDFGRPQRSRRPGLSSQFEFRLEVSPEQLKSTRTQLKLCQSKHQTSQSRLAETRAQIAELQVQRQTDQRQIRQLKVQFQQRNQRLAEFERPDSHAADERPKEAVTKGPMPRRPRPQNTSASALETGTNSTGRSDLESAGEDEIAENLKRRIAELEELVKESQRQLAQPSRNSGKPPSSDGLKNERTPTVVLGGTARKSPCEVNPFTKDER